MAFEDRDLYGGISGATLGLESFDFGHGVILSKTYAHLMAPFMMAFKPAPPGGHHPTPYRAAKGGFGFDILAQLHIPHNFALSNWFDKLNTIWWLAALLRFKAAHTVMVPVISSEAFSHALEIDGEIQFWPMEVDPQRLQMVVEPSILLEDDLSWVRDHWKDGGRLLIDNKRFGILFLSYDQSLFTRHASLSLLSLWAALETIFSPARSELRFRVSANISSFLEPRGPDRLALQKKVAKLYDARSAVAHGTSQREDAALKETYNLVRRVINRILKEYHVPSKEELEQTLFGEEGEELD